MRDGADAYDVEQQLPFIRYALVRVLLIPHFPPKNENATASRVQWLVRLVTML